ncbi:MAG: hypothetical protein P8144_11860 [Gammaproteobacteria bacterium]
MSEPAEHASAWRRVSSLFSFFPRSFFPRLISRHVDLDLPDAELASQQIVSYQTMSTSANAQAFDAFEFELESEGDVVKQAQLPSEVVRTRFRVTTGGRTVGISMLGDPAGRPLIFLAGIGGCSRLFLGQDRRGLAGYCAQLGFSCYLIDFAHKGVCTRFGDATTFTVGANDEPGVQDLFHWVTEDLPEVVEWIGARHVNQKQHWIGHGAGGLLWWAFWARYPEFRDQCAGLLQVATSRSCELVDRHSAAGQQLPWRQRQRWGRLTRTWSRRLSARLRMKHRGFLPLAKWRVATNDESLEAFEQWLAWCDGERWVDPVDGFVYSDTIKQAVNQPPCSCWVAEHGKLTTENDVRAFMGLLRLQQPRLFVIPAPFDNVSLLTAPMAVGNHFASMLSWLMESGRGHAACDEASVMAS